MVWNLMVGALLVGASVVLYDGSPTYPDQLGSWRVAATTRATVFGAGAVYLSGTQARELHPAAELDLSALRTIISAGSPLPPTTWEWVYDEFGSQVRLDSSTGGTDVCGTFIAGSPWLPVYLGELSRRVSGWTLAADAAAPRCTNRWASSSSSRPCRRCRSGSGTSDGTRYRDAYFDQYPACGGTATGSN
jgi:acetoacetyl-CoA synthetase